MAFRFDRDLFFERYRQFEGPLTQKEVEGLNFLLDSVELDRFVTRIEWVAYMLATTKHETAHTYQPIHEYGGRNYFIRRYGSHTRVGRKLGNDTPEEGAIYAGRGDVQLTGESNYEKSENALRREYPELVADFERRTGRAFDLTVGDQPNDHRDPDNAMDPAIAYAIMSFGMRTGLFTTKKLADYTTVNGFDSINARRIINGTDKAEIIASYYMQILPILKASLRDADENDILEIKPDSSAAGDPAGSLVDSQKPTSITDEAPEPGAAGSPAVDGDGAIRPAKIPNPEPYNGIGFWATIKRDLGAVTGGNITFEGLSTYAQQASGWPEWVVSLLTKVAVIVLIASIGYLVFRVIHFGVDSWKKNKRVGFEIEANTAVDKRDIAWTQ